MCYRLLKGLLLSKYLKHFAIIIFLPLILTLFGFLGIKQFLETDVWEATPLGIPQTCRWPGPFWGLLSACAHVIEWYSHICRNTHTQRPFVIPCRCGAAKTLTICLCKRSQYSVQWRRSVRTTATLVKMAFLCLDLQHSWWSGGPPQLKDISVICVFLLIKWLQNKISFEFWS